MTFQQLFDSGLPFLATLISYGLQQAHYSDKANTTIASFTILLAGGASVWIAGGFSPDILKDAGLIMAAATALQANALAPLMEFLKNNFLASSQARAYLRARKSSPQRASRFSGGEV